MATASEHFQRLFSIEHLVDIYKTKISLSETVGLDRVHPEALAKVLDDEVLLIEKKVRTGSYRFTPYKEVLLPKGAGSPPRVVSIPSARDRIVLRALYQLLVEVFPEAVSQIAQIKIANVIDSMACSNFGEFTKVDISQFYPSIDQTLLLKILKSRIRKPEIIALIEGAISTATVPASKGGKGAPKNLEGVPQGLAISNCLAEIFMRDFDKKMCLNKNIFYQRFVDDILVLCPTGESETIYRKMHVELGKISLTPHELNSQGSKSKSGLISSEFEFLGYRFVAQLISVRNQSTLKLESSFANILTAYRHKSDMADTPIKWQRARDICEWRLNLRITGCIFEGKRLGWVSYFSHITDISKLRALDHTVDSLLKRFHLTGQIKVKRLLKTYHECSRKDKSSHCYIINFDEMSIIKQRKILIMLTGNYQDIQNCSDEKIRQLFKMKIGRVVRELKSDLIEGY